MGSLPSISNSVFIKNTSKEELLNVIDSFSNKASSGWDGMSYKLLKNCKLKLINPILHLVSESLTYSIFPNLLKISVIRHLFKKG